MLKKIPIYISAAAILLPMTANAEVTTAMYQKSPAAYLAYVAGLGTGYSWANTKLDTQKGRQLYCQPPQLALGADNYAQILSEGIKNNDTGLIELTLINQLIRMFPCK